MSLYRRFRVASFQLFRRFDWFWRMSAISLGFMRLSLSKSSDSLGMTGVNRCDSDSFQIDGDNSFMYLLEHLSWYLRRGFSENVVKEMYVKEERRSPPNSPVVTFWNQIKWRALVLQRMRKRYNAEGALRVRLIEKLKHYAIPVPSVAISHFSIATAKKEQRDADSTL